MSLSELSIRRPVFAWMLMAAVLLFGYISFRSLGLSQLPDVDFPVVSVSVTLNGAAPEIIEGQVLDPIEDSIMQIEGIRTVTSTAQQSSGTISVEFDLDKDIDIAMQEIQNKIDQTKNLLPVDLFPPTLRKINPEDIPIQWVVLLNNDPKVTRNEMSRYARNFLYDQLGVVPGVGNVALGGYVDPALRVWIDNNQLQKYNLTGDDVVSAIQLNQIETPLGDFSHGDEDHQIRLMGEATSPAEFGKIAISQRANQGPSYVPIPLSEVAFIEEDLADVRKKSRYSGKPCIGLGIIKQHGSNAVEVAANVAKKLDQLRNVLPKNYSLSVRNDNTRFIRQAVSELGFTLLMSIILTSLVCYLFLGSWASTLNVLLAIPTSVVGACIAFRMFGFTLNTFTLLGISLSIGIVVDDAIMMLENIVRHREMGESRVNAALKGAEEITFAAIAATVAVAAIFVPVAFMTGVIGRYFFQYGVTVTACVFLSLLEALTLTPMRCAQFLPDHHGGKGLSGFLDRLFQKLCAGYARILAKLLRHKGLTLLVTFVFFAFSLWIGKHLPGEMMPEQDQGQMLLRFKLPVGTALPATDEAIKQAEAYLGTLPEVQGFYAAIGGFGGDAVNQAMVFLTLVDKSLRKRSQSEMIKVVRTNLKQMFPKFEVVVQDLSLRGFAATRGFPVEFIVQGPDWDKLTEVASKLMDTMKASGVFADVNTDIQPNMPEIQIVPDRSKLAQYGVSLEVVTAQLNQLFGGLVITGLNEYPQENHRYEIEVRLTENQRSKAPDLEKVWLRNNFGQLVRLSEVVTKTHKPSLMLISRLNRVRAITVYANPAPGHAAGEALKKLDEIAKPVLPPGYFIKPTGSSQSFMESFHSLMIALVLGIVFSYMVLASQFNSFIHPLSVLMALPFSISGAFIALKLAHQSINMYSMIGFILLMGIVKKNSILLVDFTNQVRVKEPDLPIHKAIVKACPIRLRPIIMTSVATIAGAFPAAFSFGPGSESAKPMAMGIMGGVAASTFLTLFVVPVVYHLLSRFEKKAEEV